MSYQATLCKLTDLKQHPNADRLQVANALGYFVIVGMDVDEDTLGVVFPSDGRLSHEMLLANNLYRKDPVTGKELGGYFEPNGRVKAIKLRGSKSEAFWTPISALAWTGHSSAKLIDGYYKAIENGENYSFDELRGHKICEKYYTPATLKAMNQAGKVGKKKKKAQDYAPDFVRHFDTTKFREVVNFLAGQKNTLLVSEKVHGTSGRTGFVRWEKRKWYQTLLSKVGLYQDSYRYVTGTRRVVYDPDDISDNGFYEGTNFRRAIHESLVGKLYPNEVVYYEVAGYTDTGALIMSSHALDKKTMKESGIPSKDYKRYGDQMVYTYGCEPDQYRVFVYRIVQDGHDLPLYNMELRAKELGLEVVPYLGSILIAETDTVEDIMYKVERLTRGPSLLDLKHIKEGVCLRIEGEDGIRIFKYKSFLFCLLEGIRKNSDEYVDLEEIS